LRAEALRLEKLQAEAEAAHADTVACVTAATFLATPAEEQQQEVEEELAVASVDEEVHEAADTQEIRHERARLRPRWSPKTSAAQQHEIEVEPQDVPNEAKTASSPGFAWSAVKADCIGGVVNAQGHHQTDREAMLTTTAAEEDPGLVDRASPLRRMWSPPVPSGCFMAEENELCLAGSMQAAVALEDGPPNRELRLSNTESEAAPESRIRSSITAQVSRGTDRQRWPSPQRSRGGSAGHERCSKRAGVRGDKGSRSTSRTRRPPPPAEEELPRPAF